MSVLVNHYSVLGLASAAGPNLTDEEISKAFKRMALRLHPDKNPRNPNAHSNFQRLLTSYNILKNPISRKEFDHLLQLQRQRQNQAQSCHHQTCNKRPREEQQQSSMKRPRHPMGPRMPSEPPKKPAFTMTEFFMEFDRIRKLVAEGGVHKVAVNEGYNHIRL
ncbi:heat shock protein binding protein, putative [Ricinus communis]|uniref:Heat shock protein binding protein, putative n=1 Tax=Ricinus communis TaxID=3988 RepID=B9TJN5_RICCO|nr:heat shock protein binding protein, putative [Ricinus communis]|eukprot:XP_002538454.1 dnaJ homolog subfamily C member 4 [Ricinus communis]